MSDVWGLSAKAVARTEKAVLYVERHLYPKAPGAGEPSRRPPRTYRRFTLTSTLNAGGSASVTWEDGSTGTVYDLETCSFGLIGETGEAVACLNGQAVVWNVSKSPGNGIYYGTLNADATTTGSKAVTIDGKSLSAMLRAAPGSGKKWASGAGLYVGHHRGSWEIISMVACPVSTT